MTALILLVCILFLHTSMLIQFIFLNGANDAQEWRLVACLLMLLSSNNFSGVSVIVPPSLWWRRYFDLMDVLIKKGKVKNEALKWTKRKGNIKSHSKRKRSFRGGEEADISFLKVIDSLSGVLLLRVFRQHQSQETAQARERVINGTQRSMVF